VVSVHEVIIGGLTLLYSLPSVYFYSWLRDDSVPANMCDDWFSHLWTN